MIFLIDGKYHLIFVFKSVFSYSFLIVMIWAYSFLYLIEISVELPEVLTFKPILPYWLLLWLTSVTTRLSYSFIPFVAAFITLFVSKKILGQIQIESADSCV